MPESDAKQRNSDLSAQNWFTSTHWSVVLSAREGLSLTSQAALERLCRAYWPPIYAFLRRKGHAPPDAQDLAQEFFARLLRRETFADADPQRGRFRTFLLSALSCFLIVAPRARSAAAVSSRSHSTMSRPRNSISRSLVRG